MRFNRLRLNGFKSFVDPTDLVIADGLTGVVGPNGCGKSNLLEALRWVMGENRPTAMRGGGMEDVIFAGAATRGARNFAEVTLTIDNSDRLAPVAFNSEDQIEIVRRITRDIGSAYKAAGKDVRARDVQMLFADASTGAHSPALVRQGQISELINARPRARRRVLEEAAGISGLYQRRHEAELKLNGASANLTRVEDILEGLSQQLNQLARQVKQAARYRELGAEIRAAEGLLLYRRWCDAESACAQAEAILREALNEASAAERAVRNAEAEREKAEDAIPPRKEEGAIAAAVLQRLVIQRAALDTEDQQARDRIARLKEQIVQLDRDAEREAALTSDAGETLKRLTWEQDQLARAEEGHEDRLSDAAAKARRAADVLGERETAFSQLTEDVARLAAQHHAIERRLEDAEKAVSRAESDRDRIAAETGEAQARAQSVQSRIEDARRADEAAQAAAQGAEATLGEAEAARAKAQAEESELRGARAEAEGAAQALRAEADGLRRILERTRSESGPLLDAVKVAPGLEAALGAALAEDLTLAVLEETAEQVATGWRDLGTYVSAPAALPKPATSLADHVSAPAVLARRLAEIGLVETPAEGQRLQRGLMPGQCLVSRDGDLWRWDGVQVTASDAVSNATVRLQQANRLVELDAQLAEAEQSAGRAAAAHADAVEHLKTTTEADRTAREDRRRADQAVAQASRARSQAEAEGELLNVKLETLAFTADRHAETEAAAKEALTDARAQKARLSDLDAARATLEEVRVTVETARRAMMAEREAHDQLRREGEARSKRRDTVATELRNWEKRLETAAARSAEMEARRSELTEALTEAERAPDDLGTRKAALAQEISTAEARNAEAIDALSTAEGVLRQASEAVRAAEKAAATCREAVARAEARRDAAQEAQKIAAERIEETFEIPAEHLLERLELDADDQRSSERLETDLARARRQRDALGAVNLRAEEDSKAVQEEFEQLAAERTELETAITKLRGGIASLNREGRERLLTAFEEVNRNFGMLFTHLFGGGEAKLVLVESDDPLEAGLEIMCQPPGKKLSVLSLLSGGEQTLTALALIFAVFLANPAPICVLDEVDAPLDDANVTRFCDLLDEMTRRTETRFLIITHHAVTMSRMDRLFGVTMAEQGVSQLVSVDLKKAESLVA